MWYNKRKHQNWDCNYDANMVILVWLEKGLNEFNYFVREVWLFYFIWVISLIDIHCELKKECTSYLKYFLKSFAISWPNPWPIFKDALYVVGMILLNEKAFEVKEIGKRRSKCSNCLCFWSLSSSKIFSYTVNLLPETERKCEEEHW